MGDRMTILRWLWALVQVEPVGAQAVVQTGVTLAVAFGLHLTGDQVAAVVAFNVAILAFLTRKAVTPNPTVAAQVQAALMQEPLKDLPGPQPLKSGDTP